MADADDGDDAARLRELEGRLSRRAVIEQAKGVLCARHGIEPEAAFERLRDRSRNANIKIADVAAQIIDSELRTVLTEYAGEAGALRLLDGMVCPASMLRAVRDASGELVDLEIDYANPAATDIEGRPLLLSIGRRLLKLYPWLVGSELWNSIGRTMATNRPHLGELAVLEAEVNGIGVRLDVQVHVLPYDRDRVIVTWSNDWQNSVRPR